MRVTLDIPDEVAFAIGHSSADVSTAALTALAIEGYRSEQLSEGDLRRLLGFETRMEVHAFLKEHGVPQTFIVADLHHDIDVAGRVASQARAAKAG